MSGKSDNLTLYIFVLILNLIFPVLSYTFTSFGPQSERYDVDLSTDALDRIGLTLVDGESHNLTWEGDWVVYSLLNVTVRCRWYSVKAPNTFPAEYNDGIQFQKQSGISRAFDNWFLPYFVPVKSLSSNEWFNELRNDTIIRDWDPVYNWSRFVLQDGHHLFVTPFESHQNISKSIWEDGTLNVTIAKSFDDTEQRFNFWSFVGWYTSLLIGDQSWGLPDIFSWIIRILAAVSIFAAIMLTKDLTRV